MEPAMDDDKVCKKLRSLGANNPREQGRTIHGNRGGKAKHMNHLSGRVMQNVSLVTFNNLQSDSNCLCAAMRDQWRRKLKLMLLLLASLLVCV